MPTKKPKSIRVCGGCTKPLTSTNTFNGHSVCKECESEIDKQERLDAKKDWYKERMCPICKGVFLPYVRSQRFCSPECGVKKYRVIKENDPVRYKAFCFGQRLVGIKDKVNTLEVLLKSQLGKKCPYCIEILTLKNCSLDHDIPTNWSTRKERGVKDDIKNLQIICRRCNTVKGDMSGDQFISLIKFLNKDPDMRGKVLKRLGVSGKYFGWKKATKG
jgi:5-methylcytosine-specific restriction endonuclease McrA